MNISDLIEKSKGRIQHSSGDKAVGFENIHYDSRKVQEDSLFVAVSGFVVDGHDYVQSAYDNGCRIFLVEKEKSAAFSHLDGATLLCAKDTRLALSLVSSLFYGEVSKHIPVIGITGTNGKTSITYMIEAVLKKAGLTPGVIGTVNYRWKDVVQAAPNTTPESRDIHELMSKMYKDGVNVIVMEVSSHGLALGRVDDIHFQIALFTNLTQDHLDFHENFEEYYAAKRKLFDLLAESNRDPEKKHAIINVDDQYGKRLFMEIAPMLPDVRAISHFDSSYYFISEESVVSKLEGISYTLKADDKVVELNLQLTAHFNVYNSSSAFAACDCLDVDHASIVEGLESMSGVPGRFDRISSNDGFYVVVDYAHTDDALSKVLESARELKPSRIITVFGCGGDRDRAKRPLMGKVAVSLSDHAIVTSDNPRTEEPQQIIDDIVAGLSDEFGDYSVEIDRESAIKNAIEMAQANDLVVIAGKGHEDYQIIGKEKIHFDDKEIAHKYIVERESK